MAGSLIKDLFGASTDLVLPPCAPVVIPVPHLGVVSGDCRKDGTMATTAILPSGSFCHFCLRHFLTMHAVIGYCMLSFVSDSEIPCSAASFMDCEDTSEIPCAPFMDCEDTSDIPFAPFTDCEDISEIPCAPFLECENNSIVLICSLPEVYEF